MKRLSAIAFATLVALGVWSIAAPKAEAGVRVGVFIGTGIGYGYPSYYGPRYYPRYRYYRPRYYAPRYKVRRIYRPRPIYRARPVVRRRGFSAAHYGFCSSRYRSYRVSDNTFQPNRGPRRQCRSRY